MLNSLRTLSDPTRIRLMHLLDSEELSVAEIQEVLGMGQSRISTHLAQLKRAGLVQDRRVGKNIYYSWTSSGAIREQELQNLVRLALEEMPEAGPTPAERGPTLSAPPGSIHAIEPPPAPIEMTSSAGTR